MKRIFMVLFLIVVMFLGCDNTTKSLDSDGNPNEEDPVDVVDNDPIEQEDDYQDPNEEDPVDVVDNDPIEQEDDYQDPNEWYEGCKIPEMGIDLNYWECVDGKWLMFVPYNRRHRSSESSTCKYYQSEYNTKPIDREFEKYMRIIYWHELVDYIDRERCEAFNPNAPESLQCQYNWQERKFEVDSGFRTCVCSNKWNEERIMHDRFKGRYLFTIEGYYKPEFVKLYMSVSDTETGSSVDFHVSDNNPDFGTNFPNLYYVCIWEGFN